MSFYNKLASIVAAYEHLKFEDEKQNDLLSGEQVAELLSIAINELYVRLEKSYPDIIDNAEMAEVKGYADEIKRY